MAPAGMAPRLLSGGWLTLLLMVLVVHHSSEAQEVQLLDDAMRERSPPRELLLGASVGSATWKESPLETATEFCGCSGFSEEVVPGRTMYKPKLENTTRSSTSDEEGYKTNRLELSVSFDDARDPGFDSGPRARTTVWQHVDQIQGAKRACGRGSKAGLFARAESQLKLPTPIKVAAGVYTIGAWVRWPPASVVPNSQGMRVLTSGFRGDFQVAVNGEGELGMSLVQFKVSSESEAANVPEEVASENATKVKNADNTVKPLDTTRLNQLQEDSLELLDDSGLLDAQLLEKGKKERNITLGATLEPTQAPTEQIPSTAPTLGLGVRTTSEHNVTLDCQHYQWSQWAACNVTCGGGIQSRTRRVFAEPVNGGAECSTNETRACNTNICPVQCVVSQWTAWGGCSKECGGVGKQNRTRVVQKQPEGGEKCPALLQERKCDAPVCDCVAHTCEPPAHSEYRKCMYLAPGEKSKKLVETEAQKKWCKLQAATHHIAQAAIRRYEKGPQVVVCDKACKQRKENVAKLEKGRGTDELFAKKAEYIRVTSEKHEQEHRLHQSKQSKLMSKKVLKLKAREGLKESEVRSVQSLLQGLKTKQHELDNELKALSDQGAQIPVVLLTKNASIQAETANAMDDLNATQLAVDNVTQSIRELESSRAALLTQPTQTPTVAPTMRVWGDDLSPRFEDNDDADAVFKSSGFNMGWLSPGWHYLAAVADASATTFYVDSQEVGKVDAVSKTDIYSIGNYQGGGFQWGGVDNMKVHSKALSKSELQTEMGCFVPLLASSTVTTSDPGSGCSSKGLSIWDRKVGPWCMKSAEQEKSIKIDFGDSTPRLVTAIATSGGQYLVNGTAEDTGFVRQYELYYSNRGDDAPTRYEGKTLQSVANGNTDTNSTKLTFLDPPITASSFVIMPAKWTTSAAMRIEMFGCQAPTDNKMDIVIKSVVGGTSVVASCDDGYGITGGGCNALNAPQHILESAPEGPRSWRCTGAGNMKAMAICAPLSFTGGTMIKEESGARTERIQTIAQTQGKQFLNLPEEEGVATATCPAHYNLVGGGCRVANSSNPPMQYSMPANDKSWVCGGNKGAKNAFVQCSNHQAFRTVAVHKHNVSEDFSGWVSVSCPIGNTLIGGGCYAFGAADGRNRFYQFNGPDGKDKWTCGGHGFPKTAYALCLNSTAPTAYETEDAMSNTPVPGTRGKSQKNTISMTCKCPSKCKCPTRAEVGYVTDPDLTSKTSSSKPSYTFGSTGFCATTEYTDHPRKTPSCMCPARAATKVMLEFNMQVPSNLTEFEDQLVETLDMTTQTKGKSCGCRNDPHSCRCRIKMDKLTYSNGTDVKWQWRGSRDRWANGRLDTVIAHVRIQSMLENGGDKWVFKQGKQGAYHPDITAVALGDKISQAIANPDSRLRKRWFFMHISGASVVNRILNKCEAAMKVWTYRDPTTDGYNNGPGQWAKLKQFPKCGSGPQSPIALSDSTQSQENFWGLNMSQGNSSTTYSNAHDDRLQFDYTNVTAQLANEGLFLNVKFNHGINGTLLFKEEGENHQDRTFGKKSIGGAFKLKRAVIHIPAEHTLEGVRHPMEVQYEHVNGKGERATVSAMLKFGVENEFLKKLLSKGVPPRCATGMKVTNVQPSELFPLQSDYYAYEGSETKPPCRSTQWYVFKQPSTVSLEQWVDVAKTLSIQRKFVETCNRHGCTKTPTVVGKHFPFSDLLMGNVRPLQPHAGRIVRGSIKKP